MADLNSIEHLIILTMENRSFDHYLGSLRLEGRTDIEGLSDPLPTNTDDAGNLIVAWDMKDLTGGYGDSPHGQDAQVASYHGGANDGFVQQYQRAFPDGQGGRAPAKIPMGYYTRNTLPILYALADNFAVCDHWFCSMLSSTWPNRKYLFSGKRDNDADTQVIPIPPGFRTVPFVNYLEDQRDPHTGNRYTWKSYFSDLPFLAFWYPFAASHCLNNFGSVLDFVNDCHEDQLPTISIIDPPFTIADDHPAHDVRLGQKFIGLIVDALTHSESWSKSALVILYDENGGFFDHVVPPDSFEVQNGLPAVDSPLGFRVPAMIVSPYSLRGAACHTVFDHTAIMKSISVRWGIQFPEAQFGSRWNLAPDIWSTGFDFTQEPLAPGDYTTPQDPRQKQAAMAIRALDWSLGVEEIITRDVDGIEAFLERIFHLPGLKPLDRRADVHDMLLTMEQKVAVMRRML